MSCLKNKDTSKLIAKKRIYPLGMRWFYTLYVWEDKKSMLAASDDGVLCDAFCCHSPWRESISGAFRTRFVPPFRGELHFSVHNWNMEVVSHECSHASIALSHQIGLSPHNIFSGEGRLSECLSCELLDKLVSEPTDEELFCYILGDMTQKVYRFLWKTQMNLLKIIELEDKELLNG